MECKSNPPSSSLLTHASLYLRKRCSRNYRMLRTLESTLYPKKSIWTGQDTHCVLHYTNRIRTRDTRYFDIEGYHPNIKTLKTKADLQRAAKYVAKDGVFIQEGQMLKKTREELFTALVKAGEITAQFIQENPTVLALIIPVSKDGYRYLAGLIYSKRVPKENVGTYIYTVPLTRANLPGCIPSSRNSQRLV